MSKDKGFWDKTKDVSEDIWDGAKNVTEDVWDGTKEVAGDIKNVFVGDKDEKNTQKSAHEHKAHYCNRS